jgi:ribosomal-protein-alanine N-acetyltransferase
VTAEAVKQLIERAARERESGAAVTYAVTLTSTAAVVGLIQVRRLDPVFDGAEWECTIAPSARGSGLFIEAAQLVASFVFGTIGARRLEARVLLTNGRGNGALGKLGAVQEGVLRRSARHNGEYVDQLLWSVLKDDWRNRWVRAKPDGTVVH